MTTQPGLLDPALLADPELVRADIVIIGAGACGLVAALAARDAGASVIVLERDATPSGSTALSSGFIPAAGTSFQRAAGILDDRAALAAADIMTKAHHLVEPAMVGHLTHEIGPALEWLHQNHGVEFEVLAGFRYPGHSRLRMHAVPEHTGAGLMARLLAAAEAAGVLILTNARATALFADVQGRIHGVRFERPDGASEDVGCGALVLACNGYGAAPDLVAQHIPSLAGALYFGHPGNDGSALHWGAALGAEARDLGACQGHGSVAHPHGVLITWALMMEGGVQLNSRGERFWNEHEGYSEAAAAVLSQPDGIAWCVYDARLHELGLTFEDYRQAQQMGAIRVADDVAALAALIGAPETAVAGTMGEVIRLASQGGTDRFGRAFTAARLAAPFYAVRVTGALFHTQGGLFVEGDARVVRSDGTRLPNLFAGGGAARGISGPEISGYLSGNGLLTAVALGRLAGQHAAILTRTPAPDPVAEPMDGYLDSADWRTISGWACNPDDPDRAIWLECVMDDAAPIPFLANLLRPDLQRAGHGNGRNGFQLGLPGPLDPTIPHNIGVRRASDGRHLMGSPRLLPRASLSSPNARAWFEGVIDAEIEAVTAAEDVIPTVDLLVGQVDRLLQTRSDIVSLSRLRERFRKRWQDRLGNEPPPVVETPDLRPAVLVIESELPATGEGRALIAMLLGLGHRVAIIGAGFLETSGPAAEALAAMGVTLHGRPHVFSVEDLLLREAGLYRCVVLRGLVAVSAYGLVVRRHQPRARLLACLPDVTPGGQEELLALIGGLSADHIVTPSADTAQLLGQRLPGRAIQVVGLARDSEPTRLAMAALLGVQLPSV